MYGSLVADLGIGPEVWLFLSLLGCVSLYFKFSRFWSVRNLDLLLLFVLAPGLMMLVGNGGGGTQPWVAFALLFLGSLLWIVRCLLDLGMSRRPLLEPNMNAAGLTCLTIGILGLLLAETVSLPVGEGAKRNPADPGARVDPKANNSHADRTLNKVLGSAPLPSKLVETANESTNPAQVILSRVLASLAHLTLVLGLIAVGWWHFDRPLSGLAMATCYLILPYTRIALVDSGQLVPAALIVTAVAFYDRPAWTGVFIGLAAGWMPATLGLVPLWAGFYRQRGSIRFVIVGLSVVVACGALGLLWPDMASWARALGARSLADAGLLPTSGRTVARQLLDGDRRGLSTPRPDRLPRARRPHDHLAAGEKPGRVDRALGGFAGGQPILVSRRRRNPRAPLSPTRAAHDVPSQPRDQTPRLACPCQVATPTHPPCSSHPFQLATSTWEP